MGMYSTYQAQDIQITNEKKLIEVRENKELEFYNLISGSEVDFGEWSGNKLEGYWYPETMKVLKELALCVTGWVEFLYEEGYIFRIVFKDGKVFYQRQPHTDWDKVELQEMKD